MRFKFIIFIVFLLKAHCIVCVEDGFYFVTSPNTVQSNSKYTVSVSLFRIPEECEIALRLNGPNFSQQKEFSAGAFSVTNVDFNIPDADDGNWNLEFIGLEGCNFRDSTSLGFVKSHLYAFVQTDKATYKPNDLIQFRVVFLDQNTRPFKSEKPMDILIKDSEENLIKKFSNITIIKGVFRSRLKLSKYPPLGIWTIRVQRDDFTISSKSFQVQNYVLPKFDVTIDAPKKVSFQDSSFEVTVRSRYTYGKEVKGNLTLLLNINSKNLVKLSSQIDGKAVSAFNIKNLLSKINIGPKNTELELTAIVKEELTGNESNTTIGIDFVKYRYNIEPIIESFQCETDDDEFKYQVSVKNLLGEPIRDLDTYLELSVDGVKLRKPLDINGMATFVLSCKQFSGKWINLKCRGETKEVFLDTSKRDHNTNALLHLRFLNNYVKVGEDVKIMFRSDAPLDYIVYSVIGHGNILFTEKVNFRNIKKRIIIFRASFEMTPEGYILVYGVRNGEILFYKQSFKVEKDFLNSITLYAPSIRSPGDQVEIKIKSKTNSYIGLMAVDQSTLLLKTGNDFDGPSILSEMEQFSFKNSNFCNLIGRSGLVSMTNGWFYENSLKFVPPPNEPIPRSNDKLEERLSDISPLFIDFRSIEAHKEFFETWFFEDIDDLGNETTVLYKKLPDTITSWLITGFSLNPDSGFALTKAPTIVKSFKPFFISTNLPYSIKQGEQIVIPVFVFNYLDEKLDAQVIMENIEDEFDFVDNAERRTNGKQRKKLITIDTQDVATLKFTIMPKRFGQITIKVKALSSVIGHAIEKVLRVEPEGITIYENRDIYINANAYNEDDEVFKTIHLAIPDNIVPNSEYVKVTVMGDILGSTVSNFDKLLDEPSGCLYEIIVKFVPNILVLHYLESINQLRPIFKEKAKHFLKIGHQKILDYVNNIGKVDDPTICALFPIVWMEACGTRFLHRAANYIHINSEELLFGLGLLTWQQVDNGSFIDEGDALCGDGFALYTPYSDVALTAFVLLAFIENVEHIQLFKKKVESGFQYLESNIQKTDDLFSLSIALYALQKRRSAFVTEILEKLDGLAKTENGYKWWTTGQSDGKDVEITGYILMTLLDRDEPVVPIAKWLISQRNSNGGFSSPQATAVGLEALTMFAEKNSQNKNLTVSCISRTSTDSHLWSVNIDNDNALVLQSIELDKSTRSLSFSSTGDGTAILQVSYFYNVATEKKARIFKIRTDLSKMRNLQKPELRVCAEYTPSVDESKKTNMVIVEVGLPSGYTANKNEFDKLETMEKVGRIETEKDDTKIVIYLLDMEINKEICMPIVADRKNEVAGQKPASVVIYDYYDNDKRAVAFYEIHQ